nr:immunoglobulin heavy chain junction region [Macaca mulatta]MOV49796.1 immunoglobulin heavy chain junction region [Macaca mulatta]
CARHGDCSGGVCDAAYSGYYRPSDSFDFW